MGGFTKLDPDDYIEKFLDDETSIKICDLHMRYDEHIGLREELTSDTMEYI